jgi:phage protein D
MGLIDFRPLLRVSVDGVPLAGFLFSQVTSVRVSDAAGFVSDTAEITFSNVSPLSRIAMPEPGAEVEIALGYLVGFRKMGLFIADEIEESSPPRNIRVICRAKAHGSSSGGMGPIGQQKTRSWEDGLTLKDIVRTIAGENGLSPAVTDPAASIVPGHIDQVDESDIAVLTRIALQHDLVAKPAGGHLFVGRRADAITASGGPMPSVLLLERDVGQWRMRRSFGEAIGSVIATYRDLGSAADIEVKVGDGEPVRRLRQRFNSEKSAREAAAAERRRSSRAVEHLELELPGNPVIVAESSLTLVGFSSATDGVWVVETATHSVSDGGFSTSVRAARPE